MIINKNSNLSTVNQDNNIKIKILIYDIIYKYVLFLEKRPVKVCSCNFFSVRRPFYFLI